MKSQVLARQYAIKMLLIIINKKTFHKLSPISTNVYIFIGLKILL